MAEIARVVEGGIEFAVRVLPRARRPGVSGARRDAGGRVLVELRVSAPPEKGRANREVTRLVAGLLEVPPSAVHIRSGESARSKRLFVAGPADALRQRLAAALEAAAGKSR